MTATHGRAVRQAVRRDLSIWEMMRPKARARRLVRASQVQARNQQLAAGDGWNDVLLLLTHGSSLTGVVGVGNAAGPG
jgi:hypothetical protein